MANCLDIVLDRAAERPSVPVALIGDPGTAKTVLIEDWARRHGLPVVKLLASTLDETDVAGIVVRDGEYARTLSPSWYDSLKDGPGVLFLDELNTGRKEVVDTMLTLICSRHLPNGDKLHDGVIIVAAMNDEEQCDNYELSPAMISRFMWVEHRMPIESWSQWILGVETPDNTIIDMPMFQTMEEFTAWFRSDDANGADKKALLKEAMSLGLKFDTGDSYRESKTGKAKRPPSSPRGLMNLIYWTRDAVDMVKWAEAFISDESASIIRSVNVTAYKNAANAVFDKRKAVDADDAEAAKLAKQQGIQNRIAKAAGK